MTISNQPSEPPKKSQMRPNLALYSLGSQIGCVTLIIVFAALFAGIGLDKLFGTKPILTLILTLGSAPLALFITFRLAMRTVKDINQNKPATDQPNPVEEEERRE